MLELNRFPPHRRMNFHTGMSSPHKKMNDRFVMCDRKIIVAAEKHLLISEAHNQKVEELGKLTYPHPHNLSIPPTATS